LRQACNEQNKEINKSGDDCLFEIRSLREQFNNILDRLEQRTISEMESRKTLLEIKIQAKFDRIDDIKRRLEMLIDTFKGEGKRNEALSYIGFTKCDEMILSAQILLQSFVSKNDVAMSFEPYSGIVDYLSSLEVLGEFTCDEGETTLPGPDHVFKVESHNLHNVKVPDDKGKCNIIGNCTLISGDMLLIDNTNSKVKLLSSSYKILSICNFPEYPQVFAALDSARPLYQ